MLMAFFFFSSYLCGDGQPQLDYGTPVTNCGRNASHFQWESELCRVGNGSYQFLETLCSIYLLAFNLVTASSLAHVFRRV